MKEIARNYHDWYLTGIATNHEDDTLKLTFEYAGQNMAIHFSGVKRSIINGFTIGNIALSVESFTGENSLNSLTEYCSLKELFYESEESNFKKTLDEIVDGKLVYVEIQPSYGCTALILCEDISEEN